MKLRRLVSFLACATLWTAPGPALSNAPFLDDAREAFRLAEEGGRPLLIDFQTIWCVACRTMERTTWKDDGVLELMRSFVPLTVDGDRAPNLVARYAVDAYPTIVIANAAGDPILELLGLQDASAMRKHLGAVLNDLDRLSQWARDASARRPSGHALLELAEFSAARGAQDHAESLFRGALRQRKKLDRKSRARAELGLASALLALGDCREARRAVRQVTRPSDDELVARWQRVADRAAKCD